MPARWLLQVIFVACALLGLVLTTILINTRKPPPKRPGYVQRIPDLVPERVEKIRFVDATRRWHIARDVKIGDGVITSGSWSGIGIDIDLSSSSGGDDILDVVADISLGEMSALPHDTVPRPHDEELQLPAGGEAFSSSSRRGTGSRST